ncbi:TraY domain-containing protein [Vibrio parahaemolyticus]|nr:TraY domain-containing protein [Vibrio parahaemolyticus]MCR9653183.1 TraY domain-containing protein [Vibrio parahaemolyticus]HAS6087886.1 TraY domain-containing protein [Vibrio vulnificus]
MSKGTSVNVVLDEKHNNILNQSKKLSGRTKRQEAAKRLSDHLERFGESWEKLHDNTKT